jgi:hypothetical protein
VSPKEFDAMKEHMQFDYVYDNHFSELREMEILQSRLQLATMAEPYLGKYFSVYQVRNRMLGYTDGEIKEIDKQISYERNVGIIPDPNAQMATEDEEAIAQGQEEPTIPEGDMDLGGDGQPPDDIAMQMAGGAPPQ